MISDYIPLTSPNLIGHTKATPRGLLYRKHSCFTTVFMDSSYLHANIASLIQLPSPELLRNPNILFFSRILSGPQPPLKTAITHDVYRAVEPICKSVFQYLSNYIQYPAPSFIPKKMSISW